MAQTTDLLFSMKLVTPKAAQLSSPEILELSPNPENWAEQLTADIKPTIERKKIKVEAKISPILSHGKPRSITSKAVIRAAMNERVKKLKQLHKIDASVLDPSVAKDHQNEKMRLLMLEKNRRTAQLSRQRKKEYLRNLESRIGLMAKRLQALEIENGKLRELVTKYTEAEAKCLELPEIPLEALPINAVMNSEINLPDQLWSEQKRFKGINGDGIPVKLDPIAIPCHMDDISQSPSSANELMIPGSIENLLPHLLDPNAIMALPLADIVPPDDPLLIVSMDHSKKRKIDSLT